MVRLFRILGLGAALAGGLSLAADTDVAATYDKWQLLRTRTEGGKEQRCEIRTREQSAPPDKEQGIPYLYMVPTPDPDFAHQLRLVTGKDTFTAGEVARATMQIDEKPVRRAYANLIDAHHLGITPNYKEMRVGGSIVFTIPRHGQPDAVYTFNLTGFSTALSSFLRCNR